MKKTSIIATLIIFLLTMFQVLPANAAVLNVAAKTDKSQISSGGTANLTVKITNSLGAPVNGAAISFTASAGCSAPGGTTTNASGVNSSPIVFTGPATTTAIVCTLTVNAVSGPDSGTAKIVIIVGNTYVPLVSIPGVGTPTSFPAYLIGLYKLALMSIAIFAMAMVLYGGFRYMTSAGNPALMGDAKDAIYSAIFGLILALLSWMILSTVNPELTVIKIPGTANNPFILPPSTLTTSCSDDGALTPPTCKCIDGVSVTKKPGFETATCDMACSDSNIPTDNTPHCFKAKMVALATKNIPHSKWPKYAKEYISPENSLIVPDNTWIGFYGDYSVDYMVPTPITACFDGVPVPALSNGSCDVGSPEVGLVIGQFTPRYDDYIGKPNCTSITNPAAVQCDFMFQLKSATGVYSITHLYVTILKP